MTQCEPPLKTPGYTHGENSDRAEDLNVGPLSHNSSALK